MKFSRPAMIDYLLSFCKTYDERDEEEERLNALTDEALEADFTDQYNSLCGVCPSPPLYEESYIDPYTDF